MSRLRIVEAADDARRRIERDLHDGAQQQLVSLALDLRMLKARLGDSGLASTVDEIGEKLAVALAELREFARGIHPGVPVRARRRRGRRGARGARAAERRGRRRARRAPARAGRGRRLLRGRRGADERRPLRRDAQRVRCASAARGGEVVVVVADDGKGGAVIEGGTGLRGLIDRLAVLDGRLEVTSPPGERHAARGAHPDRARLARGRGGAHVRAAIACSLSLLVLAGCGKVTRGPRARPRRRAATRRPPPARRPTARPAACGSRPRGIVFITHGQASDPFWTVVKRGDQRGAQADRRRGLLPRAGPLLDRAHAPLHRRGGRRPAGRAWSSRCPDATRWRRRSSAAVEGRHPRRSRSTPAATSSASSACSRTSASRSTRRASRAGGGWAARASGARCASTRSRATSGSTSAAAGSRDGLREVRRHDASSCRCRSRTRRPRSDGWPTRSASEPVDGILTLGPGGAKPGAGRRARERAESTSRSRRSISRPRCSRRCATARCCSPSTSSRTCRATCR